VSHEFTVSRHLEDNPPVEGRILIRDGTLVTATRTTGADIRIRGGCIAEIGTRLPARTGETIVDARGLYVLPGGVDPHVHLTKQPSTPPELRGPEDLESSSWAALAGGVTTVGEIASPESDDGVIDTVDRVERDIRSKSIIDVFVHPVLGSTTHKISQIDELPARGQPSLKIFLMDPAVADDAEGLARAVQRAAAAGVSVLFHCESLPELTRAQRALVTEGKTSLHFLPESRPESSEVCATAWALSLCRKTGATGYIVHVSCAKALTLCTEARAEGLPIHVETRPEFLHLTAACLRGELARLYVTIPPLREEADRGVLWAGVASGLIDVVATDDAPFWSKAQKLDAPDSFESLRMGVSGLQVLRPILFSEGVVKGRISIERFVDVTATMPARIFGLYPRKGEITVGADADLVIWDPRETREISSDALFSRTGFSLYEGWRVTGWPTMTLRRGEVAFASGKVCAAPGTGELIPRTSPSTGLA
jgi:dihydropyrimidinase